MKAGIFVIIVLIIVGVIAVGATYITTYNNLVNLQERANEGKSRVAAAVNTSSQKMKSVWALADQEGILEKETYVTVAQARAGFEAAQKEFDKANSDKASSILDLTKLGTSYGQALVNIRVAFEAYPQLRTTETYQKAMASVEEGYNEIKTALDDWVSQIRQYNAHRRSLVTNWFASAFNWEFPKQIAYYEGGIKEPEQINVKSEELNPRMPAK
jgi:LemA protein